MVIRVGIDGEMRLRMRPRMRLRMGLMRSPDRLRCWLGERERGDGVVTQHVRLWSCLEI